VRACRIELPGIAPMLVLRWFTVLVMLASAQTLLAQTKASNLILVTLDGMRWQEVFHGLDTVLASDARYTTQTGEVQAMFGAENAADSAARIFPFLYSVVAGEGVMIGDRDAGSCAQVTNPWYFSYPGYNEILTGKADPAIASNDPVPNRNITMLEWLNHSVSGFQGKVAAFGSWNVFPAIINSERSGVPVNVGPPQNSLTESARMLTRLHKDVPHLWETVRLDVLTHYAALDALRSSAPRVMYVAYGETDDFAHDGHYDQYLFSAHRTDRFLRELWDTVQALPNYRDNTVLFVTTDHGRGSLPVETWQHHASRAAMEGVMQNLAEYENGIEGSDAVWMAAMGPGISFRGLLATHGACVGSNQIAATLIRLLGLSPADYDTDIGAALPITIAAEAR